MGDELLRGVYTERSECAQHDRAILLPRHRHLRAFRLLSPLMAIPATPHHTPPTTFDGLFLG